MTGAAPDRRQDQRAMFTSAEPAEVCPHGHRHLPPVLDRSCWPAAPPVPDEDTRDAVAALWRAHQYDAETRLCTCGVMEHPDWAGDHLADEMLSVLAARTAPARDDLRQRVVEIVAFVDECAEGRGPLAAGAYRDIADRLRRALAGGTDKEGQA